MWRTLACTVGMRGLFGWKISEIPVARKLLALAGQRARHLGAQRAVHVGERDAGLLEHLPVGEHARAPAAARRPGPRILAEAAAAVDGLDARR